ncbi:hypothetical protein M409DRAFT_59367 [Zasmidium cellare ATCC 36951]|uniref:Myb-like domain-containing protein n=1 Tax=Zasmidium cellare ATCC 36951 TaxID=1080233 RepID=A0A6A6C1Z2_ZASCE|nr:uncharacterized protein M409DRAFT_59367 [Zasmidium cellare ATCC 36951]KAF2161097.1 hypothetical protein M409DRAFT_59367 [Zasmidium cellare ATCC 36951]
MANDDPAPGASSLMTFTTSAVAEPITRGPANVKGDYLEVHHPALNLPPRATSTKPSKKRKKSVAFASNDDSPNPGAGAASTSTPAKKTHTRNASKKSTPGRIIPTTFDACSEPDKLLLTLRDAGSDWPHIRQRYTALTGEKTAPSTLPNRYNRLKSALTHLRPQDNPLLLLAKRQVETSFEAQKWELVAAVVREKGGDVYAGNVLQRKYKKLMVQQGVLEGPPEGVRDGDWEVEALE